MKRGRVLVGVAVFAVFGATVAGWVLATRQQAARTPGDLREVIASYLADEDAAREKYRDVSVTGSGVVRWSARGDEITSRRAGEWSQHLEQLSREAAVMIIVDDLHEVLASFDAENQREALALRTGERVTFKGRHRGGFFTGVVYNGKVILTAEGCEIVR
jgi:hypothetical protein